MQSSAFDTQLTCCVCVCVLQAKLQQGEKVSLEQTTQITTLREELHGSLAELDQVHTMPPALTHFWFTNTTTHSDEGQQCCCVDV